ncbi:sugar phosphate isomerase/epimerase family protein [Scopulibacillus cellulosilyticus]|uniref:Sugar phosphate isomerase/epimerase family protein n=1 Tax=Scopulibacillus cellulosilyticus TaxID=2665665 RepID=A0ABW2PZE8_9BACL
MNLTMDRIAVMSVQYVQYSFEYFLDSMEMCGVKNIELWTGAPHFCDEDYTNFIEARKRIKIMKNQMDQIGMKVICVTPEQLNYPINLAAHNDVLRRRSIDYFIRQMEYALEFGTRQLFITSGVGLRDKPKEESWKYSRESLKVLSEHAEKLGVRLIMEQLQPYESNLISTCSDMVRMIQEVDSPSLQCCIDVVAMAVVNEKLEDFFDQLPGRIQHIHLADGTPSGHYVLGDGNLPLTEYMKTLQKNQYEGYITLEINDSIYLTDPHPALKRSTDYLKKYFPLL